jgi:hypothetical protein
MARFIVEYKFYGRTSRTIDAASLEAAEAEIEEEVNGGGFELDADEIDDVQYEVREMHPVTRYGREMWTTLVLKSDTRGHQSALLTAPLFAQQVSA